MDDTVSLSSSEDPPVPLLVAVSMQDLVQGVLDYFANDMDPCLLATSKPIVLVDAAVPAVTSATVTGMDLTGGSASIGTTTTKATNVTKALGPYKPKPFAKLLDTVWPFTIPRYGYHHAEYHPAEYRHSLVASSSHHIVVGVAGMGRRACTCRHQTTYTSTVDSSVGN